MHDHQAHKVMTRDVVTVRADETVRALIELLRDKRFSGFPVVDEQRHAVGVVSQNDVLRALAFVSGAGALGAEFESGRRKASTQLLAIESGAPEAVAMLLALPVRAIMTPAVTACRTDSTVSEVCDLMTHHRIHRVVVLDGNDRVVGLISATDLVRELGEQLRHP